MVGECFARHPAKGTGSSVVAIGGASGSGKSSLMRPDLFRPFKTVLCQIVRIGLYSFSDQVKHPSKAWLSPLRELRS